MIGTLLASVGDTVAGALRRAAASAAFVLAAALFALIVVAGLFIALFFWLEPHYGAVGAALACAGVAFCLSLGSLAPLLVRPRTPPPRPAEGAAPELLLMATRAVSNLTPRQMIVAAAVVGFVLALSSRKGETKPGPE